MRNYYCLISGLPDLSLDDGKLNFTYDRFKEEIYPDLSKNDKKIIDLFFLEFDNKNVLLLLKNKEAAICTDGNFTSEQLLDLISSIKDGDKPSNIFPSYLVSFLQEYLAGQEEKKNYEDILSGYFYNYARKNSNEFISQWYDFKLNINNILSAFEARKYDMEVAPVIVGNNEVTEKLRSTNARDFGLSEILSYFDNLQRISEIDNLVEREKKIDQLKWEWLENAIFFNYFTVEKIYAFLVKIEMINRWCSMDKEKGRELFVKLIDSLKDEVSIPEEFK